MVLVAIVRAFCSVVGFLLGLLPHVTAPAWVSTVSTFLTGAIGGASGFATMLPVGALAAAFAFLMLCLGTALAIRIGRIVVSNLTGGGGAT